MNSRSFFLCAVLAVSAILTGCAGTGGIQIRADLPVSINGRLGGVSVGAQGSNGVGQVAHPQQQHVQYQQQQQGHPGCQGGARPYFLGDGRPACMNQPQHQYSQPQPRQCQMRDVCDWRANVCRKVCN